MSIKDVGKRASGESLKGKNPHPRLVFETGLSDSRIQIATDFMKANLHRKIPLAELAEVANLSPSHISRLFKTQTRLSPGEYLSRLRMEKARQLVLAGLLSVKEIMAEVGYKSKSHFVRDFRRSFRLAPSEYRRGVSRPHSNKV